MQTWLLTADELRLLTGYRQPAAQLRWLERQLGLRPAKRADGRPVVPRASVEAAMQAKPQASPNWSKA